MLRKSEDWSLSTHAMGVLVSGVINTNINSMYGGIESSLVIITNHPQVSTHELPAKADIISKVQSHAVTNNSATQALPSV